MSNVYSMEPRTTGKVNLNTTHGVLSIELWGKECPVACRNFIQLCLEGYYDQSPFHRLVPGFCLQGGKPSKKYADESDSDGMAAVPGGRFPIETHSRLKFSRRGLVGMVALDQNNPKNANGSQFFITLSDTPELNGKATLFARLVGDTIFNLLRMSELEIDPKTEEPLYPPRIINTEVIINPFDDIVLRERIPQTIQNEAVKNVQSSMAKKKNISLLSFAEEDDFKAEKSIPKRVKQEDQEPVSVSKPPTSAPASDSSSLQFLQQMKAVQMRDTQDKIKQMEEELGLRSVKKEPVKVEAQKEEKVEKMSALEKHKAKFSKKKPTIECKDEMDTLLLLNSFRQKIQKTSETSEKSPEEAQPVKKHLDICKLHGLINCLSCRDTFNVNLNADTADLDEKDWMMHKLVFDRRELEGRVRDDLRDLVVIDPREQAEKAAKNNNSNKKI